MNQNLHTVIFLLIPASFCACSEPYTSQVTVRKTYIDEQWNTNASDIKSDATTGLVPVKIVMGDSDPDIVSSYTLSWISPNTYMNDQHFDAGGGMASNYIDQNTPKACFNLLVDFTPKAELKPIMNNYCLDIKPQGVIGIIKPFTEYDSFFLDISFVPNDGDYLAVEIKQIINGVPRAHRLMILEQMDNKIKIQPVTVDFLSQKNQQNDLSFSLSGRLGGCPVVPFTSKSLDEIRTWSLIQAKKDDRTCSYSFINTTNVQ